MNEASQPFGFWIRVNDEESARFAVRLAGLPVFLAGLAQGLVAIVDPDLSGATRLAPVGFAAFLMVSGLLIRREVASIVPIVCGVLVLLLASGLLVALAATVVSIGAGRTPFVALLALSWRSLVPLLLPLLLVSGVRGWWWLRRRAAMVPPP